MDFMRNHKPMVIGIILLFIALIALSIFGQDGVPDPVESDITQSANETENMNEENNMGELIIEDVVVGEGAEAGLSSGGAGVSRERGGKYGESVLALREVRALPADLMERVSELSNLSKACKRVISNVWFALSPSDQCWSLFWTQICKFVAYYKSSNMLYVHNWCIHFV